VGIAAPSDYVNLPFTFDEFLDFKLKDNEIELVLDERVPACRDKRHVPCYRFMILCNDIFAGHVSLRIGYNEALSYSGHIGYSVDEAYRGRGIAARAVRLLEQVALAHDMNVLLISNVPKNEASRRVCEKLGAEHIGLFELPEWHDMYKSGRRLLNVYAWNLHSK
jgi:tagatose 1,6-diphosphate aldolase